MEPTKTNANSTPAPQQLSDAFRRLTTGNARFRDRASQRAMASAILDALTSDTAPHKIAIEAPTGVGKSQGYLIPAMIAAREAGKHLVVSTATIALQEQLLADDIPKLSAALGVPIEALIAKGRGRYGCTRSIALLSAVDPQQIGLDLGPAHDGSVGWNAPPTHERIQTINAMHEALEAETWDGDLDAWPEPIDDTTRKEITVTASGCLGRQCPFVNKCPFRTARRNLKKADVIIANQDLLLADLAHPGPGVLPPLSETYLVIDEAHHFAAKTIEHFAARVSLGHTRQFLRQLPDLLERIERVLPAGTLEKRSEGLRQIQPLSIALRRFHESVIQLAESEGDERHVDFPDGLPEEWDDQFVLDALTATTTVSEAVDEARTKLKKALDDGLVRDGTVGQLLPAVALAAERLDELARVLSMASASRERSPSAPPLALWAELAPSHGRVDVLLSASPISASGYLQNHLWNAVAGAVLTSATMTSLGRFDRLRAALGLRRPGEVTTLALPSPFQLEQQAEFIVPWMRHEPSNREGHTAEVVEKLVERVDPNEGTLVYFTSFQQMKDTYQRLPSALQDLVLVQGDIPKNELLREHRARRAKGIGSVIFGLNLMAEGVDLVGSLLNHVIIAKLPFPVPNHPVEKAREAWLKKKGISYFNTVALAETHRMLTQVCGRLIRSETDTGRITCLDRRLVSKPYGKDLLATLPPYRQVIEGRANAA